MRRGKETCRILKEIRRQIADANDIEYITSECRFQGDCLGTCPKCEAEVQYLEQQLSARHAAGKAIALAGISAGLIISSCTSCSIIGRNKYKADGEVGYHEASTQNIISTPNDTITHGKLTITPLITESNAETVNISGCIRDLSDNEPLIGVDIKEKGTGNETQTNLNGEFSFQVRKGSEIKISYVGMKEMTFITNNNCVIEAFLEMDSELTGVVMEKSQ